MEEMTDQEADQLVALLDNALACPLGELPGHPLQQVNERVFKKVLKVRWKQATQEIFQGFSNAL